MDPWYVRARPAVERTVGTFAAAGVGAALLGGLGGVVLTGGGAEYDEFVVAWAFGLVGVVALAFAGTVLAALSGLGAGCSVRGRAAYVAGGLGGVAGHVAMMGVVVVVVAPATNVRLSGTLAALALGSAIPSGVAGTLGAAVGRHSPVGATDRGSTGDATAPGESGPTVPTEEGTGGSGSPPPPAEGDGAGAGEGDRWRRREGDRR